MSLSIEFNQQSVILNGVLNNQTITQDFFITHKQALSGLSQLNIDLKQVSSIDTAGLAWLLNICRDAQTRKLSLAWHNIPDKLLQLARLSSAETFFANPST